MLVSVTQGAKELGISVEHIRRQIRAGRWPYYKLGPKATRIDPDEIKALGRSRPSIAGDRRQSNGE